MVDQNKDDRVLPILAPYANEFPLLHLRSEPGRTRANNLGLTRASGDIFGFPDDDCKFPPDLLHQVARFFADHPRVDGLTGRSVDDEGRDSNGTWHHEAGTMNKFNLWYRSTAYTIFVRREAAQDIWYDEEVGPGAGTVWGAADEHDYLLKILNQGASIFYDPEVTVLHPDPVTVFDAAAVRRAYTYNCGAGRAIRRHGFPWWFKAWWIAKPLGGLVLRILRLKGLPGIMYRWKVLQGRWRGLCGRDQGTRVQSTVQQ